MTNEQKLAMCEVIDESFKKVIDGSFENNTRRIMTLANAREALQRSKGYFPEQIDEQTDPLMQILWQGIKEVDLANVDEIHIHAALTAVVSTVLIFLAGFELQFEVIKS
jgi:hypothetical protein